MQGLKAVPGGTSKPRRAPTKIPDIESMRSQARRDAYLIVENEDQMAVKLLQLSIARSDKSFWLFNLNQVETLYYRQQRSDGNLGGWISEHAKVISSDVDYSAVVMSWAIVVCSTVEKGVVVTRNVDLRHATLGIDGLIRR